MPFDSRFRYYHAVLRAILFDFNGVLVDDEPIHLELLGKVLEQEGIDPASRDLDRFLGISDRDALTTVLAEVGEEVAPDRISRLIARKAAYYQMRVHGEGFPVFSGAVELIEAALERDWMLGVVSGALRSEVEGALGQMGWLERFKGVVASEDVEQGQASTGGVLERPHLTQFSAAPAPAAPAPPRSAGGGRLAYRPRRCRCRRPLHLRSSPYLSGGGTGRRRPRGAKSCPTPGRWRSRSSA